MRREHVDALMQRILASLVTIRSLERSKETEGSILEC